MGRHGRRRRDDDYGHQWVVLSLLRDAAEGLSLTPEGRGRLSRRQLLSPRWGR
jgi:hypothetical protein